ncbi:unnamed protein product [Ranitomeya imitator]|uniref:Cytochrome P450 n=1 Tax=Ranitomeya imitator TaxID=111125 RepID=A0ABN9LTD2_9NEOB|nr:unnamed protein product [Ranitomeya imitator]
MDSTCLVPTVKHGGGEKVQNEIENIIGSAQPQVEHRKEMPYTNAVIHEIQRFGDVVPGSLPHATTTDITFRGYNLSKGTTVIPLLHSALRDKAYFEKPEEFYPGHFLDSEGKFKKNEAFVPFSLGSNIISHQLLHTKSPSFLSAIYRESPANW